MLSVELVERIDDYELASEALLKERELLDRVDRKFLTTTDLVAKFLTAIVNDYHVLGAGNSRWARYETCYFDTPELTSFHEHMRGRRPRFKVRIRHHVERERSFLEVKEKRNSGKTVKARTRHDFRDARLGAEELGFVTEHCPIPAGELEESVWTNFRRATLIGLRTNERITIDLGLRFERGGQSSVPQELAIIELKQPRFSHTTPAALALRALHIREASMSKYCAAVAELHEGARKRARQTMSRRLERIFE
jgi:hypothetical protein